MSTKKELEATIKDLKKQIAVEVRKPKGFSITNCSFKSEMHVKGATKTLASALLEQAIANKSASDAMLCLSKTLRPIDACLLKVTDGEIETPRFIEKEN